MDYVIQVLLLITFWVYCSDKVKTKQLSKRWYMWAIALFCGGLIGLAVYSHYRSKQANPNYHWLRGNKPAKAKASK